MYTSFPFQQLKHVVKSNLIRMALTAILLILCANKSEARKIHYDMDKNWKNAEEKYEYHTMKTHNMPGKYSNKLGSGLVNNEENGTGTVHLSQGAYNTPIWPPPRYHNETILLIPQRISAGDRITVIGNLINPNDGFTMSFLTGSNSPNYQNIYLQLTANPTTNKLSISINGQEEGIIQPIQQCSELITDQNFNINFQINKDDGYFMAISIGQTNIAYVELQHNLEDVKYLSVSGSIDKITALEFQYKASNVMYSR